MKRRDFLKTSATAAGLFSLAGCGGGDNGAAPPIAPTPAPPPDPPPAPPPSQPPNDGTLPAWRQAMAIGEWRQVPGSALASAPISVKTYPALGTTGPASKVIAWCGLAIDTRDSTVFSAANGGHNDYAGNEVNALRLSDNAPAWRERRASTPVSQVRANSSHYADGRPTSRHSYYGSVCNELRNRVMVFVGSRYGDGWQFSASDGFNISADEWDPAGTFPDPPSELSADFGAAIVEQKTSGDVYAFAHWSVLRWRSATNTWTRLLTGTPVYGFESASALDTRRSRVLIVGGTNNDRFLYDIGTNAVQPVSFGGPNAGAVCGNGNGLVYEPALDAYLLRKSAPGAAVYRIDAQTFSVDALSTSGGASIPASINEVYRRFLYAPGLGGVVYCPSYEGDLWFLRTA